MSFFWNNVTVKWLSASTRFGTLSALGTRMGVPGLLYPHFVAKTIWLSVTNVSSVKGEQVGHGTEDHGVATIAYRWALDWERHPCGI